MENLDIEVVVTSYNRWHLLEPCLKTLLSTIDDSIKVTVIEDSTKEEMRKNILSFGERVNLIFNEENIGQIKSIDKAYSTVKSKYILKVEDDYLFSHKPYFIKESIDILENNYWINNVYVRNISNFLVSHGANYMQDLFENDSFSTLNKSQFKMFKKFHCGDWIGFTFMPHVHRTSDYKKMFPNGYFEKSNNLAGVFGEKSCNDYIRNNFDFRAAILLNGVCETKHNETTYK